MSWWGIADPAMVAFLSTFLCLISALLSPSPFTFSLSWSSCLKVSMKLCNRDAGVGLAPLHDPAYMCLVLVSSSDSPFPSLSSSCHFVSFSFYLILTVIFLLGLFFSHLHI